MKHCLPRLLEQTRMRRQSERNVYEKIDEIWKPRLTWPTWGDQNHGGVLRLTQLGQKSGQKLGRPQRRKGITVQIGPTD